MVPTALATPPPPKCWAALIRKFAPGMLPIVCKVGARDTEAVVAQGLGFTLNPNPIVVQHYCSLAAIHSVLCTEKSVIS